MTRASQHKGFIIDLPHRHNARASLGQPDCLADNFNAIDIAAGFAQRKWQIPFDVCGRTAPICIEDKRCRLRAKRNGITCIAKIRWRIFNFDDVRLVCPILGQCGCDDKVIVFFKQQRITNREQQIGDCPAVMPIAHVAVARNRMNAFCPRERRGRVTHEPLNNVPRIRVALEQVTLRDMQRKVRAE